MIGLLERAAGFEQDDPPEARLAKLEAMVAGSRQAKATVSLIAALLGVPSEHRYPRLDLNPQRRKQLTLEALIEQLEGLAVRQPLLLVYEDAHWIDPSTRELLDLVVERVRALSGAGAGHLPARVPADLGRSGACIDPDPDPVGPAIWCGADRQPHRGETAPRARCARRSCAKTDGVPLFVEELTKTVLKSGLLADAGDHFELTGSFPPLAIPSTLHDWSACAPRPLGTRERNRPGRCCDRPRVLP